MAARARKADAWKGRSWRSSWSWAAGARLAEELGLVVRRDALLRRARSASPPDGGKVRMLDVDDFAFRKGHACGTILVDREGRRIVDLPERSQEGLVAWLKRHPEIEYRRRMRLLRGIEDRLVIVQNARLVQQDVYPLELAERLFGHRVDLGGPGDSPSPPRTAFLSCLRAERLYPSPGSKPYNVTSS